MGLPPFKGPSPFVAAAATASSSALSFHRTTTQYARPQPPPNSFPIRSGIQKAGVSMKVLMSRRRGAAGGLRIKKKARGFMCGCGGTKAVSISDGSDKQSPMATPQTAASTTPLTATVSTTTTAATAKAMRRRAGGGGPPATASSAAEAPSSLSSSSGLYADTTDDGPTSSMESTPSLSALLRQLGELERSVRCLHAGGNGSEAGAKQNNGGCGGGRRHRRAVSEGGGGGCVEESVAVVKESADPLADFRRSMLQMIVEKEIVGGAELRELLHRFLSLNSPQHHHLILRAFAEIWEEVFAGYERTPDFLAAHRRNKKKHQMTTTTRGAY
ncbi:plant-specific domain TIGR01568 family protein [Panicum miliaceum]|uniref:Transcription repressor n=1 Tax=Panicum miliaceum TaxID=4540 RepID=A0A3L6TKW2_PANMI|nr:plant-specific domain TIGR01568 family protein [Panicum miliaceum]